MKRAFAFICLVLIAVSLCSCRRTTNFSTVNFYYCATNPDHHTQTAVIQSEQRKIETNLSDLEGILRLYFVGPISNKLRSPFPSGTDLVNVQSSKEHVTIVLSDEISTLSGVDLMMACGCLASTVLEISQSEVVQIRAETKLLNNQEFIEFTSQNLLSFS